MKKNTKIIQYICVLIFMVGALLVGNYNMSSSVVLADDTPPLTNAEIIARYEAGFVLEPSADMADNNLYNELLIIFKKYVRDTYDIVYNGDELYSTMLLDIESINITTAKNIKSLSGLGMLRMPNLTSITIANNEISSISNKLFEYAPNVTSINFANNDISSCVITNLTKLNQIDLSSNNLRDIDLSNIVTASVTINLANNEFASMSSIKLPTRVSHIDLNIINNNIEEIVNDYYTSEKYDLRVGVQGLKSINKQIRTIDSSSNIKVFKFNIPNLQLKIYKETPAESTLIETITDSAIEGNYIDKKFAVGEYTFVYNVSDSEIYNKEDYRYAYFIESKLKVLPTAPTAVYEHKGKDYDTLDKVTGAVLVKLSAEEGSKIMYQVNGGEWQEGSQINCDQGGNYIINVKAVKDGSESEVSSIFVKTSLNGVIPDFLMFVLILIGALVLFMVVVPLVSKKFFNKSK